MRAARIDADSADRLLGGLVPPDDAPPGFAGVARLVVAARSELHGVRAPSAGVMPGSRSALVRRPAATAFPRRRLVAGAVAVALVSSAGVGAARTLGPRPTEPPASVPLPAPAVSPIEVAPPALDIATARASHATGDATTTPPPTPSAPPTGTADVTEPDASSWVGVSAGVTDTPSTSLASTTTTSTTAPSEERPSDERRRGPKARS